MAKTYGLSPASQGNYTANLRNLWNLPLQRLQIYCQPFERTGGYFKLSPRASCNGPDMIGLERHYTVIEETIPFRILSRKEYGHLLWQHFRGPLQAIDQTACVLIDHLNGRPNFFHWFLDALPRIFAAEAYEARFAQPCSLIVPHRLQSWQWDSFRFLGVPADRIITMPRDSNCQGIRLKQLVSSFSHRHIRHSPTGHFDAFSPEAIRSLSDRLYQGAQSHSTNNGFPRRLYISRGEVRQRRVLNEDQVMEVLAPYGFARVCLETLGLSDQIQLFRSASHVIAAHGGALTNLMHITSDCQVLEIFQIGHGMRPDFFQLAALNGATYSFSTATSLNPNHDIAIDPAVLHTFLAASL